MNAGKSKEYQAFDNAMNTILHADPKAVKEAMEREKRANAERRERTDNRAKRQGGGKDAPQSNG